VIGRGYDLRRLLIVAAVLASPFAPGTAQAAPQDYDIPAMALDKALLRLGLASGRQIVFDPGALQGRSSHPLRGAYEFSAAIETLLPLGLVAQVSGDVVVVRMTEGRPAVEPAAESRPRQVSSPESSTPVEELVVTALKSETLLQRTPVSISLASGLSDRGDTSLTDFFRRVPGLIVTANGTNQQRLAIRGVRGVGDATTGLYYDETPVTGPAGSAADAGSRQPELSLFDVERVEVLRGPQGTLFGAGSMGGTIRAIFNKPDVSRKTARLELRGGAARSGDPSYSVHAVGNLPLADTLAVRVAAFGEYEGGYVDNPGLKRNNLGGQKSASVRTSVAFTPTPTLTLTGLVTRQEEQIEDASNFWSPAQGRYESDAPVIGMYESAVTLSNMTGQWRTPVANILATASRYRWKSRNVSDYTTVLRRSVAEPAACPHFFSITGSCDAGQAATFAAYAAERLPGAWDQFSTLSSVVQELRASSPIGQRIRWTVGLYNERRRDHFGSTVYRADAVTGAVLTQEEVTGYRTIETKVRQTAGFGELSVSPAKKLNLTAGLRRFSYRKSVGGEVVIPNRITGSDLTPFRRVNANDDGWVTKLSASFEPTLHSLYYLTRSEGFRPGGANNVPGAGAEAPESYGPDRLKSYELGSKIGLRGGAITVNSAVYLIDWRDMQVSAQSPNGAWLFNSNAGRARITGGEVEAVSTLTPGLWLSANAAFTDARIVEDQRNEFGFATGRKGDRVPAIPRWTAAASLVRQGSFNGFRTTARLDYIYASSAGSQFHPRDAAYTTRPASGVVDVQFAAERRGVEVSARITNLFDLIAPQIVQAQPPIGGGQIYSLRPRALTVALRREF
jgi:iron complex outermembrane receptor protein